MAKEKNIGSSDRKREFRRALARFKAEHVIGQQRHGSGGPQITGIFKDRKEGEDRAIILHSPEADLAIIEPIVEREFSGFRWKLVTQKAPAHGTALSGGDVFHDRGGGQGTLGGWLSDPVSGERYGFSNNHVIASLGAAPVGSDVFQGTARIGGLRAFIILDQAISNTADLALFTVDGATAIQWAHTSPKGNTGASQGMRVYKHGFSTGYTEGTVANSTGLIYIELSAVGYWFDGVVAIQGDRGSFSESGDSGALVMTRQGHNATAILFGKDRYSGHSYAFPIGAAFPLFQNLEYAQ